MYPGPALPVAVHDMYTVDAYQSQSNPNPKYNVVTSNLFVFHRMQAVHDMYSDSTTIKLTGWIAISTAVMALFTFVMPHLHHLRFFSGVAMALIFVYVGITIGISIKDGARCA